MKQEVNEHSELVRSMGHSLRSPLVEAINYADRLRDEVDDRLPELRGTIEEMQRLVIRTNDSLAALLDLFWLEAQPRIVEEVSLLRLVLQIRQQIEGEDSNNRNRLEIDIPDSLPNVRVRGTAVLHLALCTAARMLLGITTETVWICGDPTETGLVIWLKTQAESDETSMLSIADFLNRYGETQAVSIFVCERAIRLTDGGFWLYGSTLSTATCQISLTFTVALQT